MKYVDEFRLPGTARSLVRKIRELGTGATFMEVCGTHTMAISKAGLGPMLSPQVELISGPGCPVCVTSDMDIDTAVAVAHMPGVILATFGDMVKVPGSHGSLSDASAEGATVKVVYSPLEALELARSESDSEVVFLGIGFETTAPVVAATILEARKRELRNFFVLSFHKLVPPALRALAATEDFSVDGFILPGHVSAVIGSRAYSFLPSEFGIPCVVAGFEATDILQSVFRLMQALTARPSVAIEYSRVVRPEGNQKALSVMYEVFEPVDAEWRGLFRLPASGLGLKEEYREYDAGAWPIEIPPATGNKGCRCGEVLCGKIKPSLCELFGGACTPDNPVGPCMVSTEGTCASYFLYSYDEVD
ncbi:MAG: hydrogenase formation protein HypD [Actinomycetia bacterium]|nr:hydrogenase formation protein HypD [Actinomycetes bacterium]